MAVHDSLGMNTYEKQEMGTSASQEGYVEVMDYHHSFSSLL